MQHAARAQLAAVNNQLVRENIVLRSDLGRLEAKVAALLQEQEASRTAHDTTDALRLFAVCMWRRSFIQAICNQHHRHMRGRVCYSQEETSTAIEDVTRHLVAAARVLDRHMTASEAHRLAGPPLRPLPEADADAATPSFRL
jgi:hypothetical protein